MGAFVFKSENQILGDQLTKFLAETGINDVNPGSVVRTLLEANAQELFQQYVQLVNILRNYNLDTTTETDLDNRGFEFGLTRNPALQATGLIKIKRDPSFVKVSTGLYSGFPAPSVGDTILRVNDASNSRYATSGTLIVGRGTSNEEEVTFSVAPTNQTNYWQFTVSPFSNNHGSDESVILKQGSNQVILAGTQVIVPASGSTAQLTFTTDTNVTLLAGEAEIANVPVTCSKAGTVGNIPIKAISGTGAFQTAPFTGAQAENNAKYTTGQDREIDEDFRNRIKNAIQSLSKATKAALSNAIRGLVDPTSAKRVVSSNIVLPASTSQPVKIYIDDGTGFEPSFSSRGFEQIIDQATGGENRVQLDLSPMVKAQVETSAIGPFDMSAGNLTLTYQVGLVSETITFFLSDFAFPTSVTAQQIVAVINNRATLIEARTSNVGSKIVISAVGDTNEDIQVTGGTANSVLLFPTDKRSTLYLYVNDVLQSKDGSTAFVDSANQATYNFNSLGGPWVLNVTVDGKSANPQVVTFTSGNFVNPAQATATEVVTVINAQLAGATASVLNSVKVRLTSNTSLSARSKLQITGGNVNGLLGFPTTLTTGTNSNYTLNRQLGVIELATALSKNDTVTAASKFTRAFLRATSPENYTITAGQSLVVSVDGGADQTIVFSNSTSYTAAAIASIINTSLLGASAIVRTVGGVNYLELRTNSYDQPTGSIRVQSSTTATAFGFVTTSTATNQRPHKAYLMSGNTGPYTFLIGQTLVSVIDNNPATNSFIVTMGYGSTVTSTTSTTVFAASALANVFSSNSDLVGFYAVASSGSNTVSGSVASVASVSGSTWQYNFSSLPTGLAGIATNDHVTFTNLQNLGNNGTFLVTAVNTSGNGYIRVTNVNGIAESGSTGTALIGQRRQITAYNATTGQITVGSAFSNSPGVSSTFALLPATVSNVVTYLSNRKVSTLSSKALISGVANNTKVQIESISEGSDGAVQVTGGSANPVLGFSTTQVNGLEGYKSYTNLVARVHKTIYGDDQDLVSFPGVGAAGVNFQILAPTVQIITVSVSLALTQGVSVSAIQDQVKSAITGYVNSLGVGDDVVLKQIITRILAIDGILDVNVVTPTGNIAIADNELARTSDANITVG